MPLCSQLIGPISVYNLLSWKIEVSCTKTVPEQFSMWRLFYHGTIKCNISWDGSSLSDALVNKLFVSRIFFCSERFINQTDLLRIRFHWCIEKFNSRNVKPAYINTHFLLLDKCMLYFMIWIIAANIWTTQSATTPLLLNLIETVINRKMCSNSFYFIGEYMQRQDVSDHELFERTDSG